MYHLLETRGPRSITNVVHIGDDDHTIVSVWEIKHLGQDELWERAQLILDFLNQKGHTDE